MLTCYRHGSFLVFCCWGEDSESLFLFFSHGRLHWRGFFFSCAGVPESKGKQHNDVRVSSPSVCSLKKLFIKKRWPPSVRQIITTKVGWRCPSCRKIEISIKLNASQGLVTFLDLTFFLKWFLNFQRSSLLHHNSSHLLIWDHRNVFVRLHRSQYNS